MTTDTAKITESVVEHTTLEWFEKLGYHVLTGPQISPGETTAERDHYKQTVLEGRLRTAMETINPHLPANAVDDAMTIVTRTQNPNPAENNRFFHRMLTEGVNVSFRTEQGEQHEKVWLLDLEEPENNDWLAVNQFTVKGDRQTRRPDILVFVNGLPLAVIELKNPTDETATIHSAFNQLQTYKKDIPALFETNELMIVSDGLEARMGTLTSGWDRFMPWRTVDTRDGFQNAPKDAVQLETMINGIFHKPRFLDLILNFIVFESNHSEIQKKIASYHQFHAVNKAVEKTFSACGYHYDPRQLTGRFPEFIDHDSRHIRESESYNAVPDHFRGRRIGVVWHTQGSGKSLTMAFFAGKLIRHPGMQNPTIVVITDRNDLDQQLYTTFSACNQLLRQNPVQADDIEHLKDLLQTASGGVVFTTIQKFMPGDKGETYPLLSDRENIIVIADEAHRSQYGFIDGFARHLRDAL
ncbi:MAG: type I restriction endonuclease subunit R, partial [bacterium]|nr:type I restriction endonuclease subunit R [bacterium]